MSLVGDASTIEDVKSQIDQLSSQISDVRQKFGAHNHDGANSNRVAFSSLSQNRGFFSIGGIIFNVTPLSDLQAAIDYVNQNGGGTVVLGNGTYNVSKNLTLYSNVNLQGQTENGTIIDFGNGAFSIKADGANPYTTGTISCTTGTLTVTGSGTSWTASMAGQSILLSGLWYIIASVNVAAQTLTLATPFADTTLSGSSYTIASILQDINISFLTVQNSTSTGIDCNYVNNLGVVQVTIINCTTGISVQNASVITISQVDSVVCGTGMSFNNCAYIEYDSNGVESCSTIGVSMTTVSKTAMRASFIIGNTNNGLSLTSCSVVGLVNIAFINNSGKGLELISGNSDIQFLGLNISNNGSDGIKLTASSNKCNSVGCQFISNGGYGLNIANSNDNNNLIVSNQFSGNSSGAISDSGTSTIQGYNTGVDVPLTDYTGSSTITGWTTFNNKNVSYQKFGKIVFVIFNIDGTSNSTSTSFTLPYANNSGFIVSISYPAEDNGNALTGYLQITDTSSTANFFKDILGTVWTNVGRKIIAGQFSYVTNS